MKKNLFFMLSTILCQMLILSKSEGQNVGIGTTNPNTSALLHIDLETSTSKGLLVTGTYNGSSTVPDLGAGSRMMFYPGKSAFRAGYVSGSEWNDSNVGPYSIAMGINPIARGLSSVALGENTTASGYNSTALGYFSLATGGYSTAFGYNTKASGLYSFAAGVNSTASGTGSLSLGSDNIASGSYALAFGFNTKSLGTYSLSAGLGNVAKGLSSLVVGTYNDSILTSNQEVFSTPGTPLFIIGNGVDHSSRSNAVLVQRNGNMAIGNITPHDNAILHVDLGASTSKGLLVTGAYNAVSTVPDLGAGTRMMFYPGKSAFRAGYVDGAQWNNLNVGEYSVALGFGTQASGTNSTAMGFLANASGSGSAAMGSNTIASGTNSTAMGNGSNASGTFSTAMGFSTKANAHSSTSLGYVTSASGSSSISMGQFTIAKGYSSTVMGMWNDSILLADQIAVDPATPLLIVGNGDGHTIRSNAMVVRKDGNVGIGTNTPDGRIHTKANSTIFYPQLMLEESENDYARLSFKNNVTPNFWTIAATPQPTNAASLMNFYYQGFGDVLSLKGNGNATLAGTLTQLSDSRLKKNIISIDNALDKLTQLNGYNYYWSDENKDQSLQTGVLAQEVEKVLPELVKKDEKGILSVNYSGIVPVLIQSIKEQQKQILDGQALDTYQQEQIEKLKKENLELKARLDKLDKILASR